MGSTTRHTTITTWRAAAAVIALAGLGVAACGDDSGDDTASPAATEAAAAATAGAPADLLRESADGPAGEEAGGDAAPAAASGGGVDVSTLQVPGQAIAIEARATLQADDVRAAVDGITSAVTTRGGRVAAADIDYTTPDPEGDPTGSRATLVLEVPPAELAAVADALDELGTVLSFDQLAEDVTDQLADLDTRIGNLRASIERVRALYAEAVDIDSIVRLEAELTRRETDLELLLASQKALEDRVAMSTLTVDIAATPEALEADDDRPGVVDALAAGWGALAGGLFTVVLVLSAITPFVVTGLVVALLALWIRQLVMRRRPAPDAAAGAQAPTELSGEPPQQEAATANRPG